MPTPIRSAGRFARTMWHREPWWAEWVHAWGVLFLALLIYGSTVDMAERPNLVLMAWMSDECWATLGAVLGGMQILMLLIDCRLGRWLISAGALWLWLNIVISILFTTALAHPPVVVPLALAGYSIPVMTCVLSVTRLLRA